MTDTEVSEGDDAKFDVRIGGADVEVDWYRDDELLDDEGRIIIEDPHPESDDNLYSLTIENCGPNDSGRNRYFFVFKWLVFFARLRTGL